MAIELRVTKEELDRKRDALRDCYICGTPLRQAAPELARVTPEHIIPRALLRWVDAPQMERVPLLLNVHKACDDVHKGQADELIALLVRFIGLGERSFKESEKGLLRKRTSTQSHYESDGISGAAIVVPGSIQNLLHIWARGLLAFLYGRSLPQKVVQISSLPVPLMKANAAAAAGGFDGIDQWSKIHAFTTTSLRLAMDAGKADNLVAWGGHIRLTTAWRYLPQLNEDKPWVCFWALELPGQREWSHQTMGYDIPFHGTVGTVEALPGGTILTEEEVVHWQEINQRRMRAGLWPRARR